MDWALALVGLAMLGVAAVSQRLAGTPLTPAMLFVAFGLLVGPKALDGIDVSSSTSIVRTLAEATLAEVDSEIAGGRSPATLLLEEIGYGVLGGIVAGLLIAAIVTQAGRRGLIAPAWRQVIPAAGAALAYGIASALDGSGFIA